MITGETKAKVFYFKTGKIYKVYFSSTEACQNSLSTPFNKCVYLNKKDTLMTVVQLLKSIASNIGECKQLSSYKFSYYYPWLHCLFLVW